MLKIHDSKTGAKVEFEPIIPGKVSMYVCGPTVYDNAHLGHGRSAVAFDVIRRFLIYKGYEMTYASNYTDIDDKMIKRADEEGITVAELADKVIPEYEEDYGRLNILPPDIVPKATECIDSMIKMVEMLMEKGFAYELSDGVYFDVSKFADYGKFSGQNLEELQMGARIDVKTEKRNPQDFVLWKLAKDDEPYEDYWDSPWGEGRPGWHIECSAMTWEKLGESFDVHGGGLDLKFPHHECEVAQTKGCFGENSFAKYWLHNGFIQVDNEKMSKSLGNFFTLKDVFKKYDPVVVRFMFLQTHYRNPINFSDELLEQAKSGLKRLHGFVSGLRMGYAELPDIVDSEDSDKGDADKMIEQFEHFMDNDFDTSGALGAVFNLVGLINGRRQQGTLSKLHVDSAENALKKIDRVLAVIFVEEKDLDEDVEVLIKEREEARAMKNWARSDEIRDELAEKGIVLEDTAEGTVWRRG